MSTRTVSAKQPAAVARRRRTDIFPYLLLLPSVILISLINLYPFASGFYYSLQDGTLIKAGSFVGLENYLTLLSMPEFHNSLWFSVVFSIFSVFGSYIIGLMFALLLNQDVPGRGFFRVALLVPWIIPSIVSITSWRWLIGTESGLINQMLGWVGAGPIYFLSSSQWAIFSVILVKIWRSFPFMMLSLLAALQGIDRRHYEAAAIDGASRWTIMRRISLPLAMPAVVSNALYVFMIAWNEFLFALLFLAEDRPRWTVSLGLAQLAGSIEIPTTVLMAGSVLLTLPIIVLFFLTERLLVEGLTSGAEKG
jgi:ABC-type sugar transport system permease subunit